MANTTNFGWETPDDTDLVKDGAAAMRTLGNAIDASLVDLKGGTTGQILAKNTNTDMDFVWITNDQGDITAVTAGTGISGGGTSGAVTITNSMATAIDAKGDLIVGTGADTFSRLPVGSNGQIIVADSAASTGLKYVVHQDFIGCSVQRTNVSTVLTANATYLVAFNSEEYDTNAFHDNVTNNSRLTIPTGYAGKYLLTAYVGNALGSPGSYFELGIYRNGSQYTASGLREGRVFRLAPSSYLAISQVVSGSANDYFEIAYQQNSGETVNMWFSAQFVYLGA